MPEIRKDDAALFREFMGETRNDLVCKGKKKYSKDGRNIAGHHDFTRITNVLNEMYVICSEYNDF